MKTKDKLKAGLIFSLIILAVIGMFLGFEKMSVISEDSGEIAEFPDASCSLDIDCDNYFLGKGISQFELNEQKELATLECGNQGFCIAEAK